MKLDEVYDVVEQIANLSSRLDKINFIKNYVEDELFKKVVIYTYSPYLRFKVKKLPYIDKISTKTENIEEKIFNMLDKFASQRGVTNDEIMELSKLCSENEKIYEIVRRIVNKDLRCGASVKTFKKCGIDVPDYCVMLCIGGERELEKSKKSFNRFLKTIDYDLKNNSCWSEKKNGVRCTTLIFNNYVNYLSRSGKEYPNFGVFDNEILKLHNYIKQKYNISVNFDGEVIGKDKTQEGFDKLISNARSLKKCDPEIFQYHIFDIIVEEEKINDYKLIDRYRILQDAIQSNELNKIFLVKHYLTDFEDYDEIFEYVKKMNVKHNWEGIVLKNIHSVYEFKRSPNWLKAKATGGTIDVTVIDYIRGTGKYSDRVGALLCETSDGIKFKVGSGLSDEDRLNFMENLPEVIEISYQVLTKDNVPLTPTFVRVRDDL